MKNYTPAKLSTVPKANFFLLKIIKLNSTCVRNYTLQIRNSSFKIKNIVCNPQYLLFSDVAREGKEGTVAVVGTQVLPGFL